MNGTTKQRYFSTTFWADEWVDSLPPIEKLIYINLLTNAYTNAAGVYPYALKYCSTDTGCSRDEVNKAIKKFEEAGKAYYYREYMIIPKWLKHQKVAERSGLWLGAVKVIKSLPDYIKDFISDRRHYDYDITGILESVSTPTQDPLKTLPPEMADPPPENNRTLPTPSEETPQKTAHDLDLDIDSEFDLDIDNNIVVVSTDNSQVVENSTTTTEHIKKIAKALGFFLSAKQASEFLRLDNKWLIGENNFLAFAASKIQEDTSKTHTDHERIFAKAWNYQNLLQEYPDWLKKKKIEDNIKAKKQQEIEAEKERQRKIKIAFENKPTTCSHCGSAISIPEKDSREICANCGWVCEFQEDELAWVSFDYKSITEEFKKIIRKKNQTPVETLKTEDIDF